MKRLLSIITLIAIVVPLNASAYYYEYGTRKKMEQEEKPQKQRLIDLSEYGIPPILDPNYRSPKKGKIELAPYISSYLGDQIGQTWLAGGRIYYNLTNYASLGANYGVGKLYAGPSSDFGRGLKSDWFHVTNAELLLSNDVALRAGKTIIELDLFMTLGVGAMWLNQYWKPLGVVGGGVKAFLGEPWFAIRVDVVNYIHEVPRPPSNPIDCDVVFMGGISLFLPIAHRQETSPFSGNKNAPK